MVRLALLLTLATVLASAQAPPFEIWAETTATAWRNEGTDLNFNFQHRNYPSLLDAYSSRVGLLMEYRLRDGLSLWGGTYFHHIQSGAGQKQSFVNYFRYFGGFNYRLYHKGLLQIDGRTAAERFVDLDGQDFTRFRHRVLVGFNKPVAPYFSGELFSRTNTLLSHRATFGIRTNLKPEWSLLTGFIWENRSFNSQPTRYWLVLNLIYRKRAR